MTDKELEELGRSFRDSGFNAFEAAMVEVCKHRLLENRALGSEVWSALANVDWSNETLGYREYGMSFRTAGRFIADMLGDTRSMAYMDWYCSGPYATVAEWIEEGMAKLGWTWEVME